MWLALACIDPEVLGSPEERLDAALPGLAAATRRYTDTLGPIADVVDEADPSLVRLLLPEARFGPQADRQGESAAADLRSAELRIDGTVLSGFVAGDPVARTGGWVLADLEGGPAPDWMIQLGAGTIVAWPLDADWRPGPAVALAGTSSLDGDTVRFTVDLGARVQPGHVGPLTAATRGTDGTWDFGPGGAMGIPEPHAVATLVALVEADRPGWELGDPDLLVATSIAYGGWRALVDPELWPEVESDAADRYAYGRAVDTWLADHSAAWRLADAPALGKLLWAAPGGQNVVYGAIPIGHAEARLDRPRYRFHVPDVATLEWLRDTLPLEESAWGTTLARDDRIWDDLEYRATDAGMSAQCASGQLDRATCSRWRGEIGATLGEVDGVPIRPDQGTSVALQASLHDEDGRFVGDCAVATHLSMAALQAVGLVPLGLGYAGPNWAWPTHDLPLVLLDGRFVSPQVTPGRKWHRYDTFVYVALPALDPRATALGWEPDGWARGGAVAGGRMTYGALDTWLANGIPLETVGDWIDVGREGGWPEVGR